MNNSEIIAARNLISKIDSGEGWVFGEHVNTENEIAHKLFRDKSDNITGVFFSCMFEGNFRIDIAFENDVFDEDINKSLWDMILYSSQKRTDSNNSTEIWLYNENRNIIKYLETVSGNADLYGKRYASIEYVMRRENFSEEFAKSRSGAKNIVIKPYEAEKIDEYLYMLDMAMTFSPHDFRGNKEGSMKMFDEYSKAEDKEFEAFWDNTTGTLIGVYWRKHIEIDDMAVSPEYQRKGYGSLILTRAIKQIFKNPEKEFARLYCVDWNEKGQAFYKKYGMEINGHSYQLILNKSYKNLRHVKIDIEKDKDYILERHCRMNYECDTPWARKIPYEQYRANWYDWPGQQDGFWSAFTESIKDERTILEIIKTESGENVGYLWVQFHGEDEKFIWADVQDIYVEESFRKMGIATYLMDYAEKSAKQNGAKVIRSGTGCENIKSQGLHKKLGYYQYRYEYEKVLNEKN